MSAFVIGFSINTVKSFIEANGYKVKESENADESKNQKKIAQSYKLEYNYKNKLENLGNIYFFSDDAKGILSESFLPIGIIYKGNENNPAPFQSFIPEKNKRPPYEIFPISEQKKPIIEVFLIPEKKSL